MHIITVYLSNGMARNFNYDSFDKAAIEYTRLSDTLKLGEQVFTIQVDDDYAVTSLFRVKDIIGVTFADLYKAMEADTVIINAKARYDRDMQARQASIMIPSSLPRV